MNLNRESEEENGFKKSKSANNSTLSLHISAYENLVESNTDDLSDGETEGSKNKNEKRDLIKKWEISSLFFQNPFEFPRQQNDRGIRPEMMQFKASQRLRNPNEENFYFNNPATVSFPQASRPQTHFRQNSFPHHPQYDDRQRNNTFASSATRPSYPPTFSENHQPQQQSDRQNNEDFQSSAPVYLLKK
uniref:Uncharacterized protein n=1 Tax=Panagrolaimus sp. ES5 TaxID=591445 RepID=A0AC34FML4_9BILA